jgi:type VI secretion system FHA domain protein
MAVTIRFQSSGAIPTDDAPVTLRGSNLTVGRGEDNDLVLPDPDRMISKTHCVIEDHNGNIVVVDLSTNGTFLNYGKVALGPTPTPLNDGDVLVIGPYELVVAIGRPEAEALPAAPAAAAPVSPGRAERAPDPLALLDEAGPKADFLDDLLGEEVPGGPSNLRRDDPAGALLPPLGEAGDDLLGPAPDDPADTGCASAASHSPAVSDSFSPRAREAAVIPDDWDEEFLAPHRPAPAPRTDPRADPPAAPPPDAPAAPPPDPLDDLLAPPPAEPAPPPAALDDRRAPPAADPAPPPAAGQHPAPAPQPAPPQPAPPAAGEAAARAFLAAAGAADVAVADADLAPTMARLGRVLRIMVEGLREILMTRTQIKSEFRISQTMIGAGRNNPLKFSVSPEQAIEAMVRPASKGYLDAATAAEEALRDLKAHEVAMVSGMEAALKGVLARLDPKALEARIEGGGGVAGLLKGRKARYWEVYEKLYAEIADQAGHDFHELFAREFARAYQDQLERLK